MFLLYTHKLAECWNSCGNSRVQCSTQTTTPRSTLSRTRCIDCCLIISTRELPTPLKTIREVENPAAVCVTGVAFPIFCHCEHFSPLLCAVDDEFERVSSHLLKRTQAMLDKYRYLLFAESKVSLYCEMLSVDLFADSLLLNLY